MIRYWYSPSFLCDHASDTKSTLRWLLTISSHPGFHALSFSYLLQRSPLSSLSENEGLKKGTGFQNKPGELGAVIDAQKTHKV